MTWDKIRAGNALEVMALVANNEFGLHIYRCWEEGRELGALTFCCAVDGRSGVFRFDVKEEENLSESAARLFREWRLWLKGDRIANPGVKLRPGRRAARTALKLVRPVLVMP